MSQRGDTNFCGSFAALALNNGYATLKAFYNISPVFLIFIIFYVLKNKQRITFVVEEQRVFARILHQR